LYDTILFGGEKMKRYWTTADSLFDGIIGYATLPVYLASEVDAILDVAKKALEDIIHYQLKKYDIAWAEIYFLARKALARIAELEGK
jgi:hypothetical protein